jgi:hypothetical protein
MQLLIAFGSTDRARAKRYAIQPGRVANGKL